MQKKFHHEYDHCFNKALIQELKSYNHLLLTIRNTLECLERAVCGFSEMTDAIDLLATSLINSKVPIAWTQVSYPSFNSLPCYILNFLDRFAYFEVRFYVRDAIQNLTEYAFF